MAIFDLTLHQPSRTLVAASHNRSQWKLDLTTIPVAVGPQTGAPRLALSAPAPNPSRGSVTLLLDLPSAGEVHAGIYDALGRRVRTLYSGALDPGAHPLSWNGLDESGRAVAAGVYLVRANAGGATAVRRIVRVE
jgi:flagellar hook assembly protein FlgD